MRSGRTLRIDKTFHEHGHGELIPLLIGKVEHFAEFYGFGMEPQHLSICPAPKMGHIASATPWLEPIFPCPATAEACEGAVAS